MSIKLNDGTVLRNLEEQVQYLTNYHDVNQGLVQWGIRVVGQVETADELPLPYDGEYGDAIAVGTSSPFFFYIWTRASIEGRPAYWFPFGEISVVGPEGPQGAQGPVGPKGEGSKWYTTLITNAKDGDMSINATNGNIYRYADGIWTLEGNIKGPQGIQGIQGPQGIQGEQGIQGPKGDTGDVGGFINIYGTLTAEGQLPSPASLNNLTIAYLIGSQAPYDLYVQIGENSDTAIWTNTGPFNAATAVQVNSVYQNVWNADTKLDKSTNITIYSQAYAKTPDGSQNLINVTTAAVANAIVQRKGDGNITVPATASNTTDAVSKQYVDNKFVHLVRPAEKNLYYFPALSVNNDNSLSFWSIKGTPEPSGEKVVLRSKQGRAQMQDPVEDMDIANKRYVDALVAKYYIHNIHLTNESMTFGNCDCYLQIISKSQDTINNLGKLTEALPNGSTICSGLYYDDDEYQTNNRVICINKSTDSSSISITYNYNSHDTRTIEVSPGVAVADMKTEL